MGGIYQHGLEKTKKFQANILRDYSNGGFSFSCRDKVNCGEPLHKNGKELAKTLREFDIRSSYGYAGSNISTPVGFCTGYTNEGNGLLIRCDRKARFHSFEFLSVFYTLWKLENEEHVNIKTVYSNFHQYGYLQLGKYQIDLTVITQEGKILLFAFDGDFVHGCRKGCPSLKRYVGDKSRQDVEEQTNIRDVAIQQWCSELNLKMECDTFVTFKTISNCHEPGYNVNQMKSFFQTKPQLLNLINGYMTDNAITQDEALFCSEKLTFLAILEGFVPGRQKPLLIQNENELGKRWNRFDSTATSNKGILMTRDFLKYLTTEHNFQVTKIQKIYFYKKCSVLPKIFSQLVTKRATNLTSPEQKELLKNIVNYVAGYFGFNETKQEAVVSCRLVTELTTRFNCTNTEFKDVCWIKNTRIMFLKKMTAPKKKKKAANSALPIFVSIVEFGKLRLSQILCFFEKYLMPDKYRFLYSNVDNALVALSTDNLDQAADPNTLQSFFVQKKLFFAENQPGHLKEEFVMTPERKWKFVSGTTQNYAILTNDIVSGIHKTSALQHVDTQTAYNASCAILNHQEYNVDQVRRTSKLENRETKHQNHTVGKKEKKMNKDYYKNTLFEN